MKKIFYIIIPVLLLILPTCTKEGMEFDTNGGKGLAFTHFVGSSIVISTTLDDVDSHSVSITISSTVKSDQDRAYTMAVDPSSTAIEGTHYTLSSKTVIIPAGQYSGSATLTVIIDNLTRYAATAVFNLEGDDVIDYGGKMTVSMNRSDLCEFETSMLAGTFSYYSDPDNWDESGTVTITADPDNPYKIYINQDGIMEAEEISNGNGNAIELDINPGDFSITGPKTIIAPDLSDWGMATYTNYYFAPVSGTYDVCEQTYTITFLIGVDQGDWGENVITFTRK